jgi:predicted N-acetyltransferase YhbS
MLVMRLATSDDRPQVARMIEARCTWLEHNGLESWRPAIDDLVSACDNTHDDLWVLEDDEHGVVGQMLVQDVGPPFGWTEQERAEPALYLSGSVTDPALRERKLGSLMAWWAVDRAARLDIPWVRRHCHFPQVARYNLTQGFELVREEQRTNARVYVMARRAERLDLSCWFGDEVRV